MLSSPDLSFPGLKTDRAFCIFMSPGQSDCDKSTVLACLSGGWGTMVNDFCTDVWTIVTDPRLIFLLLW